MFRYIIAMSEYQKEIRRDLVSSIKLIDEHLVKCVLYPESINLPHWKQEIYNFLHDIDKLKGKGKYPSYRFIREALSTHEDVIDNYIHLARSNYPNEYESDMVTDNEVADMVKAYHDWLAYNLSNKGYVSRVSVYAILNAICNI